MPVVAKLKYLGIAPRKVRLVADLIRGKSVEQAQTLLHFTVKKANEPVLKLLKSAIASAHNNFQLQESNLYICKISVDEGPKYKRHMPRARGQAYEIQKKTSHVTLWLDEIVIKPPKESKLPKGQAKKVEKIKKTEKVEKIEEKISKKEGGEPKSEEKTTKGDEPNGSSSSAPTSRALKEKTGLKPTTVGIMTQKPKIGKGVKRLFRRKAF